MTRAFAIASADYGNIGDALIYRRALRWSEFPRRNVFVGRAPRGWLEQLSIPRASDEIYGTYVGRYRGRFRPIIRWAASLAFGREKPALFFDTGETPLDRKYFPREVFFLILTLVVRARRGVVVRPPNAVRVRPSRMTLAVYRLSARMSQFVFFRNEASAAMVGTGTVVPDMGFSELPSFGAPVQERRKLIVSMRGHTPAPRADWYRAIADFAAEHDLDIVVVTQVSHDEARSHEIAVALGAQEIPWEGSDLVEMERVLVGEYDQAAIVISDRMHVLVYASSRGAVAAELVDEPTQKIRSHFEIAGIGGVSANASSMTSAQMVGFLKARLDASSADRESFVRAGKRLNRISSDVRESVGLPRED